MEYGNLRVNSKVFSKQTAYYEWNQYLTVKTCKRKLANDDLYGTHQRQKTLDLRPRQQHTLLKSQITKIYKLQTYMCFLQGGNLQVKPKITQ
jgi:hypothetical protein